MSLILKSDNKASKETGRNIFNIATSLDRALFVADFGVEKYAIREGVTLKAKSFSDVINYSRTGYTEYFSKQKSWQTVGANIPAIHFDKQSNLKGLLGEGAVAAAEQIINRQGADVLSSETVTTQYRSAFVWLLVQGTGSVTVSGDIENRVVGDGLIATENKPLYLRFVDNAGSSNLTFTTQGDVTAFSMVRVEMPGSRVPYFNKNTYQSRGVTNISLTDAVKNIVNAAGDYTFLIDMSSPYGVTDSAKGFYIGQAGGIRLEVVSNQYTPFRVFTRNSAGIVETVISKTHPAGVKNLVVALTVLKSTGKVIVTNCLLSEHSRIEFDIGAFDLGLWGTNNMINRIAVFDGVFSQTKMRELVNDWQVFS